MKVIVYLVLTFFLIANYSLSNAKSIGQSTGYELPRYVSLKSNESNLRVGASKDYPKILTYVVKNFPLEITNEYKQWREVEDIAGNQGWMHESLFQGDRYGIIKTNHSEPSQIFNKPEGTTIGKIGNKNIVKINKCLKYIYEIIVNIFICFQPRYADREFLRPSCHCAL